MRAGKFIDAIRITSGFEGKDFWGNVSHPFDFDGQNLSCGAVQFTYASGNMQKVVKLALPNKGFLEMLSECAPKYGQRYLNAMVYLTNEAALEELNDLKRDAKFFSKELRAFWSSKIMIEAQKKALIPVHKKTLDLVKLFESATKQKSTDRSYWFFFDIVIQNGSLKESFPWEKKPFVNDCFDFMLRQTNIDTKRNLVLWERAYNTATEESKLLFLIGYKRALLCRKEYIADVLNRKGTIALGTGWVHQEKYYIKELSA